MTKRNSPQRHVKSINIELVADYPDVLRDALSKSGWSASEERGKVECTGEVSDLIHSVEKAIKRVADPPRFQRKDWLKGTSRPK